VKESTLKQFLVIAALALAFAGADRLDTPLATASNPMTIVLDARKAPVGLAYTHMTIPVAPGSFTVDFPEWLPGDHSPDGPLNDMAELVVRANGKPIAWHRDQVDMYAFHLDVPSGVHSVDVDYTVLLNSDGTMATPNMLVGNWNLYLLYQRNIDNEQYYVRPSIIMPDGWDYASALPGARRSGNRVDFDTVTLETLVDSPTDMGRFVKHVTTWSGDGATAYLDMFADGPEALEVKPELIDAYKRLITELTAFYGGRHWNVYHAELTLSDEVGFEGIEHHQSSDNRAPLDFMTDDKVQNAAGDLVPHEISHSWNGKYRRPLGLQEPNFNDPYPELGELLWQYEGMNQYIGDMMSFRSGIREPKDYPEYLAALYARLANEPGRNTTPLADTTIGAPYYFLSARGWYPTIRRTAGDHYGEGELIWLDADTIIREQTHGTKSLDDYAKVLAGGTSAPKVVTYTRADLEDYLNQVTPYDWHGFFQKYIYTISPQPPTDMIERAGYKLVYNDKPNAFYGRRGDTTFVGSWYDVGANLTSKGIVMDVREGSPAWNAGLAPTMEVVAVNGREFGDKMWTAAIVNAKLTNKPIDLYIKSGGWYSHLSVAYYDGVKIPHLERIPGTADMLADIMRPHASASPSPKP
jgi:predicted metalloprotease with PDZ domain